MALSYGSVPMYKMVSRTRATELSTTTADPVVPRQICQTTGWGGQPVRAPGHGSAGGDADMARRLEPATGAKRIRVTFNASVSDVLPWKFVPQQREVRVLPGETALAFYTATNRSDKDIIGVATYSVTPAQLAPYFSKIQCFCFEEQRLNAGETVDMPVFFYLDPDLLDDLNTKGIETVTLSYTFFRKPPQPQQRSRDYGEQQQLTPHRCQIRRERTLPEHPPELSRSAAVCARLVAHRQPYTVALLPPRSSGGRLRQALWDYGLEGWWAEDMRPSRWPAIRYLPSCYLRVPCHACSSIGSSRSESYSWDDPAMLDSVAMG